MTNAIKKHIKIVHKKGSVKNSDTRRAMISYVIWKNWNHLNRHFKMKKKMFFQLLAKYLWPKWIYPLIIRLLEVRHALNFWNLFVFTYLKKENQCYQRTHQFRSYIICRMLSNIIVLVFSILFQDWTWIFLCFLLTCDPNLLWKWMSLCTLDAWT